MDLDCPKFIYDFHFFGLSFLIWKQFKFEIDICETYPYAQDGEVPLIFITIGCLDIIFENKWLYKKIYNRRHGFNPIGLED